MIFSFAAPGFASPPTAELREALLKAGVSQEKLTMVIAGAKGAVAPRVMVMSVLLRQHGVRNVGQALERFPGLLSRENAHLVQDRLSWFEKNVPGHHEILEQAPFLLGHEPFSEVKGLVRAMKDRRMENIAAKLAAAGDTLRADGSYDLPEPDEAPRAPPRRELLRAGVAPEKMEAVLNQLDSATNAHVLRVTKLLREEGVKDVGKVIERFPAIVKPEFFETLQTKLTQLRANDADYLRLVQEAPFVLEYNLPYDVYPRLKWLRSHGAEDVAPLLAKAPELLTAERWMLNRKAAWLTKQNVPNVAELLADAPFLLTEDERQLGWTVGWLREHGVKEPVGVIVRAPSILKGDKRSLNRRMDALARHRFQDIGKVLEEAPFLLDLEVKKLDAMVSWLRKQGVRDPAAVLSEVLPVLKRDIETEMVPLARFFQEHGVRDWGKLIEEDPPILTLELNEAMRSRLSLLLKSGIKRVSKVLPVFSHIAEADFKARVVPKLEWLRSEGFTDAARVIEGYPALLASNLERNMAPTWKHLHSVWGLSTQDIEANPMVLGASLKRLEALTSWIESHHPEIDLKRLSTNNKYRVVQRLSAESMEGYIQKLSDELAQTLGVERLNAKQQAELDSLIRRSHGYEIFLETQYPKWRTRCLIQEYQTIFGGS